MQFGDKSADIAGNTSSHTLANITANTPVNTSANTPVNTSINSLATAIDSFDGQLFDPIPPETRERLLRLLLGDQDSLLLPLQQITEILSVDFSEVLPVPEMPHTVVGICNWRGEMLWLVDLNCFVGYPSFLHPEQSTPLTVIVIEHNQQTIGLIVPQVYDVELHDLQPLQPPPIGLFPPDLLPLIQGVLPGCSDAVLDLRFLIQCPLWKKHPKGEK